MLSALMGWVYRNPVGGRDGGGEEKFRWLPITSSGATAIMALGDWGWSMLGPPSGSGMSKSSRLTSSRYTSSVGLSPRVWPARRSSTERSSSGSNLMSTSRSIDCGGHSDGELGPSGERLLPVSWYKEDMELAGGSHCWLEDCPGSRVWSSICRAMLDRSGKWWLGIILFPGPRGMGMPGPFLLSPFMLLSQNSSRKSLCGEI